MTHLNSLKGQTIHYYLIQLYSNKIEGLSKSKSFLANKEMETFNLYYGLLQANNQLMHGLRTFTDY